MRITRTHFEKETLIEIFLSKILTPLKINFINLTCAVSELDFAVVEYNSSSTTFNIIYSSIPFLLIIFLLYLLTDIKQKLNGDEKRGEI